MLRIGWGSWLSLFLSEMDRKLRVRDDGWLSIRLHRNARIVWRIMLVLKEGNVHCNCSELRFCCRELGLNWSEFFQELQEFGHLLHSWSGTHTRAQLGLLSIIGLLGLVVCRTVFPVGLLENFQTYRSISASYVLSVSSWLDWWGVG